MHVNCIQINPENSEIDKLLYTTYTHQHRKGWIEVGEEKICLPEMYAKIADEIENFEIKDSDIILATYPKTGTTWTQELLWMIINNLDFERGKELLYIRSPFLEFQGLLDYTDNEADAKNSPNFVKNSLEMVKNCPYNPRIIKTHLPFSLLPKQIRNKTRKPKIIYVTRNPKDVCVSYYHHCKLLEGYKGNLDQFLQLFLNNRVGYSPFFKNVLGYWNNRNEHNILFLKYEEMKKDLASVIRTVANYVNRSLTEDQIKQLQNHLSFENMKKNNSVNLEGFCDIQRKNYNVSGTFMRVGKVGTFRQELNEETIKKFDEWTNNALKNTGLTIEDSI